jgi:hypothetical protein
VNCGLRHDQRDLKSTAAGKDHSSPAAALIEVPHDVSAAQNPFVLSTDVPYQGIGKDRDRRGRRATRKLRRHDFRCF